MKSFGFQWHLTDKCNLRCRHCYQDTYDCGGEKEELAAHARMADAVLGGVSDRQVSINLTGGEPLLLPHLADLLEHIHRSHNLADISIITNGTVAQPELLESLSRFPRLGTFKVSLESADAAIDDAIRGRGNLERVVGNLPAFVSTGRRLVLMMTLSRRNLEGIRGMVDLARLNGASGVLFERFVPMGRGRGMTGDVLSCKDWSSAVLAIARCAGQDVDPTELSAYKAFWLDLQEGRLSGALCNLGDESMALMPDGTVFPCRRLPIPAGNVLAEPFDQILGRLAAFAPEIVRPRLSGIFCPSCGFDDCAGCRALARALSGDTFADDPQCPLLAENTCMECYHG